MVGYGSFVVAISCAVSHAKRRIEDIPRYWIKCVCRQIRKGERGTWQRISRRRMGQSRNFASNGAPYRVVPSYSLLSGRSNHYLAARWKCPGISYPRRPAPHLASTPKTPDPAELLLKDYAVTHVLTRAPRREMCCITMSRPAS